jgi:hypothetical protein
VKKAQYLVHRAYLCTSYEPVILGAFGNLRKATISYVMYEQFHSTSPVSVQAHI